MSAISNLNAVGAELTIGNVLSSAFENAAFGIEVFKDGLANSTGVISVVKSAISGLWTVIAAHPVLATLGALSLLVVGFNKVYKSAEEANEKMQNSLDDYQSAKDNVDSINSQLSETEAAIDRLEAKESLSFMEESELERLKQATEQLQIQADLAEKAADRKAQEAGNAAVEAYKKNFKDTASQQLVDEYYQNSKITGNNAGLIMSGDLSAMIAGYKAFLDLKSEATDPEDIEYYGETVQEVSNQIWEEASKLETYREALEAIPENLRSSSQKEALEEINSSIELIYKNLDPAKWKQISFDKLLNQSSIKKVKDELVTTAKESGGITADQVREAFGDSISKFTDEGFTVNDVVAQINAEAEVLNMDEVEAQIIEKFEEAANEAVDGTDVEVEGDVAVDAELSVNGASMEEFNTFLSELDDTQKTYVYDIILNQEGWKDWDIEQWQSAIDEMTNSQQEVKNLSGTIEDFYAVLNDTEEGSFTELLDASTEKLDLLQESISKLNSGELAESDITTLEKQFPELINYTDDLSTGLDKIFNDNRDSLATLFDGAIKNLDGSEEAQEAMRKLKEQYLDLYDLTKNGVKINIDTETSKFSNMYAAAKNSRSATGLTNEDISNIKSMYSGLSSYDPSSLFERTENGIHLNTKALRELEAEYEQVNKNEISSKLRELRTQLESLGDAESDEKSKIQAQIENLEILQSQYEGLTSTYNKWIQAQSSGNERDMYEAIGGGRETVQGLIERGWIGSDEVRQYIDLISGKDLSTAPIDELMNAWKEINSTIEGTNFTAFDFFTKDKDGNSTVDGVYNFFDAVNQTMGDGYVSIEKTMDQYGNEISQYKFDFSNGKGQEVADKLGLDAEYIQSILRAAIDAGFDVNLDSAWEQDLDQVVETVQDKRQELENLGTEPIEINLDVQAGADGNTSAITSEIEKVTAEIERINDTPVELRTEADTKNLEYYSEALDVLIQKKIEAEQPGYMSIDASSATASMSECLQAIQNYKQAENELNALKLNPTADTTQIAAAEEKVKAAAQAIQGLPTEAKTKIGIDGEDSVDTIIEKMKTLDPETDIFINADAGDSVSNVTELKEVIDGIDDKDITIGITVNGLEDVQALKDSVAELADKSVDATATAIGKPDVDGLKAAIDSLYPRTVAERANVYGTPETRALKAAIDSLYSRTVVERANVYGTGDVNALRKAIDSLYSKTVTTTHVTNNVTNNIKNPANGTATSIGAKASFILGSAYADGSINTHRSGDWSVKDSGVAFGGEVGQELVVRDGHFFTIGDKSAEFFQYKKGDIIFNAEQTKQIFEKGKIVHGKRRGKSFATGTAFADASTGAGVRYSRTTIASWSPTSSSNYTPSSGYKQTRDTSKNTRGDSAFDKFKNWLDKLFDWVEVKLERQTRKIEKYTARADAALEANSYSSASSNYVSAISATASQITNNENGAAKYKSTADQILSNAIGKGIISKNGAKSIAARVANGTIDISEYSKNVQEVIKAYQEWYNKSLDCADAVETLHQNIRKYVQSLKDVRDAQRDTTLESIDLYSTIGTSSYTSTSGSYYGLANSQLSYANTSLRSQNAAYDTAVANVTADATSLGNNANSALNSQLKKVNTTISKKTKNYKAKRAEYKKALKNAQAAIKKKQPISSSDLKIIKKYSTSTYEQLYAFNIQLSNIEAAKLEQATAYAANSSDIYKNTAEKYSNLDSATNNKMDLYKQKANNATSAQTANKYLENAAAQYNTILANDQAEINEYNNDVTKNKATIQRGNSYQRGTNYAKLSKEGKANVDKYIDEAQSKAKEGKAIGASTLAKLAQYYSKGYITLGFYQACIDYNNALEHKREAEAQYAIDQETAKAERAALGTQMVNNVIQEYTNRSNANAARTTQIQTAHSLKTTRGLSLTKSDYKDLINQSKADQAIYSSEVTAIQSQIQRNLTNGYWTTSSQEYKDALMTLEEYRNKIQQCAVEQEEWNNSIAQLPYKELEDALGLLDAIKENYKALISINVAKGIAETANQYRQEIANANNQIAKYTELRKQAWADYIKASNSADGVYGGKTADEWLQEYYQYDTNIKNLTKDIVDLNNSIAQLPYTTIEKALSALKSLDSYTKSMSDLKSAQGYDLSESDYTQQIAGNNSQIKKLEQERSQAYQDYLKALADADGVYGGKTADEWLSMYYDFGTQVNNLKSDNEKLKDELRDDVFWRSYERAHEACQRYSDILSGIKDLIDDDLYFDKNGKLTKYGVTQIANLVSEYENAQEEVANYSKDISNLNSLYAKGYYTEEEYKQKLAELQKGVLDAASDMKSALSSIKDMYKEMEEAELDNLFKIIDARNKALSAKKEYYDYDKTIKNKTKDIQTLQAQIAALDGVATSEAKAKRAKLEAQLAEAQDDLNETITNHMFDLSQDSLDGMKDALQEAFDDRWEEISMDLNKIADLMASANSLTSSSAATINSTLNEILRYYGINPVSTGIGNVAGFAKGTRSANKDQSAWVNELGTELLVKPSQNAILASIEKGDGIIPANLTDNLFDWGEIDPAQFIRSMVSRLNSHTNTGQFGNVITQHYDSLLNVEGNVDSTVVTDLNKFAETFYKGAYNYAVKEIVRDAKKAGIKA